MVRRWRLPTSEVAVIDQRDAMGAAVQSEVEPLVEYADLSGPRS